MSCLFSPAGITKVFFPSNDSQLPGLVFRPTVTNRLPFLTLVFISPASIPNPSVFPAPSCPISESLPTTSIPVDSSTPSPLPHVSATAGEAHDDLIRLPDCCTAEHLGGAVTNVDVIEHRGASDVVDVLNGGVEDPRADVVLNGGVDFPSLHEVVSEDVKVDVRVTGSDSSSSSESTLTLTASSPDFLDLEDRITLYAPTRYYIRHYFPCVLPFNLSSILNATSESACFSFSPFSFSYNTNSSFHLSPDSPLSTLTLSESSFSVLVRQLPMHPPFSSQNFGFAIPIPFLFPSSLQPPHDFTIIRSEEHTS